MSESDFLAAMVAASCRRVEEARRGRPLERPFPPPSCGRLLRALRPESPDSPRGLAVIAEIKRASPSRGPLAPDLDAAARARAYERAGTSAVSVLTESEHFGGCLEDLRAASAAVSIPTLRKDFLVDPYQVREAVVAGAAGVLLIAAALGDARLKLLLEECAACGLDALVECHTETEVRRALRAGAAIVGINNRDLTTLTVDLATTGSLAHLVPPHLVLVAESGIHDGEAAAHILAAGADAVLVGEALVGLPDEELSAAIATLSRPATGRPTATLRRPS